MSVHFVPASNRYALEPHDKVTVRGIEYRPISKNELGLLFIRCDGTGVAEMFPHDQLSRLVADGELKHERGRFLPAAACREAGRSSEFISDINGPIAERLHVRMAYVDAFLELERNGQVMRTEARVVGAQHLLQAGAISLLQKPSRPGKRSYAGSPTSVPKCPSPGRLLKWVRQFEAYGYAGLAGNRQKSGNRTARMSADELALMMSVVRGYCSPQKPTKQTIYVDTQIAFKDENKLRSEASLVEFRCPSRETVRQAILKLDPFQADIARLGLEAARARHTPIDRGLDLIRPLQRVEIDEWKIDLISIMSQSGLGHLYSEEDLALLGLDGTKDRWWVSVAICATTRCILAMKLVRNPSASSAIETLQMSMQDKGSWADAVGALSPWDMAGIGELYVTDCGAAFKSKEYRAVCADLSLRIERAIAGMPWLRGWIERMFLTACMGLLPRLTGRTFSNAVERGAHKPEERAVLTSDELSFALVRWVVDIYHNTPHSGLNGATPAETWRSLVAEYGVAPPPDLRARRLVFGTQMTRVADKSGITVMGVRYHSDALAQSVIHGRARDVAVRWLPENIGAIEAQLDGKWRTVPAVFPFFKGLAAQTWLAAARNLRAQQRTNRKFTDDIVHKAIKAIEAMNRAAEKRADLKVADWSNERIVSEEDRLFVGFNVGSSSDTLRQSDDGLGFSVRTGGPLSTEEEMSAVDTLSPVSAFGTSELIL
ncbi:DDE-type integrase/transposase/recombinase [Limimaricola sp. G21655-S1]|uniref:DDE-type integrase/transposase/recombinase n=1 Tax=Limimaricola sp. G21655-S1 TaxID=3014768 RepID=UPI0022AF20E9|nr:DDE-type integrase/transposase/recombinase [Limimaricola sp. G21655-S1]MCZ4262532.1 DDE-type integrase/transposase/recombinase [Limimaricola sp. G21655-S1]